MKHDTSHPAPLTLELIVEVNAIVTRNNLTTRTFMAELNKFLPSRRQIQDTHPGTSKLNRWLNPTGKNWCEPLGEIVLAMQKWVQSKKKRK